MKYLVFSMLFLVTVFVKAQEVDSKPIFDYKPEIEETKIKIGGYVGINSSMVTSDVISTDKGNIGYQYGFFLSYNQPLFVKADFTLNQISTHISIPDTADPLIIYEDCINVKFFNMPIQVGYNFIETYDVTAWFGAGVYYEFFYGINDNKPELKRNDLAPSSFGALASAGIRYNFLIANLSYSYGLGPFFKDDMKSRKRVLAFSVGFRF